MLDEYEPIYEPIDQEDSDQPSQPTEVSDPNTDICPELNNLLLPIHLNGINPTSLGPEDLDKSFSRSLTASPYVGQAKPFRPFSTEPQEIPPLEEPIILNPDYNDVFKEFGIDEEYLPKTKFKLPISVQYDPDGTKQKIKIVEEICESVESHTKEMLETITKQEVTFIEEMKKEIDIEKIEKTATSIVEDSLEKAVVVAEEIKREIDVELHEVSLNSSEVVESSTKYDISATSTEIVDSKSVIETAIDQFEDKAIIESKQESVNVELKDAAKEVSELVNLIDKTTEEIIIQNGSISETNEIRQVDVKKQSTVIGQKKIIETDKAFLISQEDSKQRDTFVKMVTEEVKSEEVKIQDSCFKANDIEHKVKIDTKSEESKTSDRRSTSTRAEQRAYTIGLQTIPNIRGTVHSSYHYNLLLKTFFIHLTDVMVALSRFILSEPVLDKEVKEEKSQKEAKDLVTETLVRKDEAVEIVAKSKKLAKREVAIVEKNIQNDKIKNEESEKSATTQKVQQVERKEVAQTIQEKYYGNGTMQDSHEKLNIDEMEERRKLSGSRMAQLVEKKSEELTHKMDAVITEFQNKAGIEETTVVQERSSSRSGQDQVIQENAPALGLLSKVDFRKTEEQTKTEISKVTSTEGTFTTETRQSKERSKSSDRNTYIAIVEAHVYTNKNVILDEQLGDFSETSSVVSADEVNIPLETNEALSTEKVALEDLEIKEEVAKSVVEEQQLIAATKEENFKVVEEEHTVVGKKLETVKAVQKPKIVATKKIELKSIEQKAEVKQEIQKAEIKATPKQEVIQKKVFQPEIKPAEKEEVIQKTLPEPEIKVKEKQGIIRKKLFQPFVNTKDKKEEIQTVALEQIAVSQSDVIKEELLKTAIAKEEHASIEKKVSETETAVKVQESAETTQIAVFKEVSELRSVMNETSHASAHTEVTKQDKETITLQLNDSKLAKVTEAHKETKNEIEINRTKQVFETETKIDQESIFIAKSVQKEAEKSIEKEQQKLVLQTDLPREKSDENNNTPTPTSIVPPTPLTDEYIFKLEIPLPKRSGTPIPRDCTPTPEDEDPDIVKKKFLPFIDTKIEDEIKYDPPLKSPPTSPKYTKPGLRGGADKPEYTKVCLFIILYATDIDLTAFHNLVKVAKTRCIANASDCTQKYL